MAQNLFGSAVPAGGDEADGTDYALGTRFTPGVNGTVTGGRWRFPATIPHATTPVQVGLYRVSDQALLASASFPLGATLGAWNEVTYSSPASVTAGVTYATVIWTPLRYVATPTYAWPVTSGDLTASSSNGWLAVTPGALVFPTTQSGNSASYFADVVFEPAPPPSWTYGFGVRIG